MTNAFLYLWSFVIGLCIGSFANVVALRDRRRASIVTGRSECPRCRHRLAWYDLVPVLSFCSLGGRCRYCRRPISPRYVLVELLTGGLAVFALWQGAVLRGSLPLALLFFVLAVLLLIVSLIDMANLEVPLDYVVAVLLIGGFGAWGLGFASWQDVLLGLAAGAGSVAAVLYGWKLLFKQDGMGVGDIWIAGAVGAAVGYPLVLVSLMSAVGIGALFGMALIAVGKKKLSEAVPFGPFLFIGFLVALAWGQRLIQWYIL